jgi:hypothetical protein
LETRTTVGVVGLCHGYPEHIKGWLDSVRSLNRKPDKIVLVLYVDIKESTYDLDGVTVVPWFDDFAFSDMLNLGFEYCDTEWIAWIGIDDRYRPHALDKLDTCKADVLALGFEYDTGQIWTPANVTAEQILSLQANMIPCGSPVRRWVWNENTFDQRIAPYDDWCFWIGTAVAGATYDCTLSIDVDYAYAGHFVPCDVKARSTIAQYLQDVLLLQASRIDKT